MYIVKILAYWGGWRQSWASIGSHGLLTPRVSSVSDHLVMGGNGLSRPGGKLGIRVEGFRV